MSELMTEIIAVRGVTITVQEANGFMAAKRSRLGLQAIEAEQAARKDGTFDEDEAFWRMWVFPPIVAATVAVEGLDWPLSCEELMALPDEITTTWYNAVHRLNPHWLPKPDPAQDLNEKKGSSPSPETPTSA